MDLTLDQLLTVIGRLDDTPGFDTPRERYRRFLNERMNALESARLLIDQCRTHSGEQSHRALQDAIVLFGRFLGFHTAFGRYQHDPATTPVHGQWDSRRRLQVALIVCTDQMKDIDADLVSRGIGDGEAGVPQIALLVVTPLFAGKDRLEQAIAAGQPPNVRLISLRGLVRLGRMVADGQLTHEDVLQVLNPPVTLDVQLDLIERSTAAAARRDSVLEAVTTTAPESERQDRRYWVNAMRPEPFTQTERIVGSLIASRQILGINPAPGLEDRVKAGDAICVFIAGRGVVAHAQIAGFLADGSRVIRDSTRFTHVLRLTGVMVYETPVVPPQDLVRKLDSALGNDVSAVTTAISRREFESITAHALSQAG